MGLLVGMVAPPRFFAGARTARLRMLLAGPAPAPIFVAGGPGRGHGAGMAASSVPVLCLARRGPGVAKGYGRRRMEAAAGGDSDDDLTGAAKGSREATLLALRWGLVTLCLVGLAPYAVYAGGRRLLLSYLADKQAQLAVKQMIISLLRDDQLRLEAGAAVRATVVHSMNPFNWKKKTVAWVMGGFCGFSSALCIQVVLRR